MQSSVHQTEVLLFFTLLQLTLIVKIRACHKPAPARIGCGP